MSDADAGSLPEEERSRADCYALLSRLFYAAPDGALLDRLAGMADAHGPTDPAPPQSERSEQPLSVYVSALRALQHAAAAADAAALRQQYDDLFVAAGKAPVTPYTSAYALPHAPDRHLLALRERLNAWGLARRGATFEVEDHVSAVCDVMRWLIGRGRSVEEQRAFFIEFVDGAVGSFCSATIQAVPASFYAAAAEFARAFLAIEKEAFDLHTAE